MEIKWGWKYRHYFGVVEEGKSNLRAQCTLCPASIKPLLSARNTTSNFKKHIDTAHKMTALVAMEHDTNSEDDSSTPKQKKNDEESIIVAPQAKGQCMFVSRSAISPAKIRSEFVIEDILPLSMVKSPAIES